MIVRSSLVTLVLFVSACAGARPEPQRPEGAPPEIASDAPPAPAPPSPQPANPDSGPPIQTLMKANSITCDASQASAPITARMLLAISAPAPPPEGATGAVVHRYKARAVPGARLDPAIMAALDAANTDYSSCVTSGGDARLLSLTLTIDSAGRVTKVSAQGPAPDAMSACLMRKTCALKGAPAARESYAVVPLRVKEVVARRGVAPVDPPVAVITKSELDGRANPGALAAIVAAATQAASACQDAVLPDPSPSATLAIGFTPHSTVAPTVSVEVLSRGKVAPTDAMLACVQTSLDGKRMGGRWWGGRVEIEVTWDP